METGVKNSKTNCLAVGCSQYSQYSTVCIRRLDVAYRILVLNVPSMYHRPQSAPVHGIYIGRYLVQKYSNTYQKYLSTHIKYITLYALRLRGLEVHQA